MKRVRPTALVEGPLDALALYQKCDDLANVVATAGVKGGRSEASFERLKAMPLVLIAFDADDAGDRERAWWLARLPNARRVRTPVHDSNDMLMNGYDVHLWLDSYVSVCCVCQESLIDSEYEFYYDERGYLYCQNHWSGANSGLEIPPPVDRTVGDRRAESLKSLLAFVDYLNREVFPLPWKVTINPPGFTIDDRIRELQAEYNARHKAKMEEIYQQRQKRLKEHLAK